MPLGVGIRIKEHKSKKPQVSRSVVSHIGGDIDRVVGVFIAD